MEQCSLSPSARHRRTGMQQYLLPCCHELAGSLLQLVFDGFGPLEIRFEDECRLLWRRREHHAFMLETYSCRKLTNRVYFITAMLQGALTPACATLVWDADKGLATLITARVGQCAHRPRLVTSQVYFGASRRVGQPLPPRTQVMSPPELVGKHVLWTYNQHDTVLHIFHSAGYFRLGGPAHGPDGSCGAAHMLYEEPAFYIRLRPHLYLYGVTEDLCNRRSASVGGNQLVYLMDSLQCRCVGSIFGLDAGGVPELLPISAIGRMTDQPDPMDALPFPLFPDVMTAEEIAQTRQEVSDDAIRG